MGTRRRVARIDTRWPDHVGRGFLAVATVDVLLGRACTPVADREQAMAAQDVAAWPLRGNLTATGPTTRHRPDLRRSGQSGKTHREADEF
jgi:hypothetical protein